MIDSATQAAIRAEYDKTAPHYRDLASSAADLTRRILAAADIPIHSINSRLKERDSLAGKLARPDKTYTSLADITDVAAIRITTYFADDVDAAALAIEREFDIDRENSVDQRARLDPDRFGYQSLHYVARLTKERQRLVEYHTAGSKRFEIQVRSILQHAWAEIEHDLGYKSAEGVPRDIRRRFARVAGLLELADVEFCAIRDSLQSYASAVPSDIQKRPESIGIDNISLKALAFRNDSALSRLSIAVAEAVGAQLIEPEDRQIEVGVSKLKLIGIESIARLEEAATAALPLVGAFAKRWFAGKRYPTLHKGIGTLYLFYIELARTGDETRIREALTAANVGNQEERTRISRLILDTYASISTD